MARFANTGVVTVSNPFTLIFTDHGEEYEETFYAGDKLKISRAVGDIWRIEVRNGAWMGPSIPVTDMCTLAKNTQHAFAFGVTCGACEGIGADVTQPDHKCRQCQGSGSIGEIYPANA